MEKEVKDMMLMSDGLTIAISIHPKGDLDVVSALKRFAEAAINCLDEKRELPDQISWVNERCKFSAVFVDHRK